MYTMKFSSKTKTKTKTKTLPLTLYTTTTTTILCFFFFFFFCCLCLHGFQFYTANYSENKFLYNLKKADNNYFKDTERSDVLEIGGARRVLLGGPGSSPPRCMSKCGGCMPCKPVHVPVPPGMRVTTEYYPEAWRCKCGNKLYMP